MSHDRIALLYDRSLLFDYPLLLSVGKAHANKSCPLGSTLLIVSSSPCTQGEGWGGGSFRDKPRMCATPRLPAGTLFYGLKFLASTQQLAAGLAPRVFNCLARHSGYFNRHTIHTPKTPI